MRFIDLLRMSSGNLWKRKVRTVLTVLGVVIGVASIVVMLSLGLGLKRSMMEQYESYGSLTQITVNQPWSGENCPVRMRRLPFSTAVRCCRISIIPTAAGDIGRRAFCRTSI